MLRGFELELENFFAQIKDHERMVLSTSLNDKVTSRMMSIIVMDGRFYFQTDMTFRKYEQLKHNTRVALCSNNIQIEGLCEEIGRPVENTNFCLLYHQYFSDSYDRYTKLDNERLFVVSPIYIQEWIYEKGKPFVKMFDFTKETFTKKAYIGQ